MCPRIPAVSLRLAHKSPSYCGSRSLRSPSVLNHFGMHVAGACSVIRHIFSMVVSLPRCSWQIPEADLCSGRAPGVGPFHYVSVSPPGLGKRTEEGLMWPNGDEPYPWFLYSELIWGEGCANLQRGQGVSCGEGREILIAPTEIFSCTRPSLMGWGWSSLRSSSKKMASSGEVTQAENWGLKNHRGAISDTGCSWGKKPLMTQPPFH